MCDPIKHTFWQRVHFWLKYFSKQNCLSVCGICSVYTVKQELINSTRGQYYIVAVLLQAVSVKYKIIQTHPNVKFHIKIHHPLRLLKCQVYFERSMQKKITEYLCRPYRNGQFGCFHSVRFCRSAEISPSEYKCVELGCSQCISTQRARKQFDKLLLYIFHVLCIM